MRGFTCARDHIPVRDGDRLGIPDRKQEPHVARNRLVAGRLFVRTRAYLEHDGIAPFECHLEIIIGVEHRRIVPDSPAEIQVLGVVGGHRFGAMLRVEIPARRAPCSPLVFAGTPINVDFALNQGHG